MSPMPGIGVNILFTNQKTVKNYASLCWKCGYADNVRVAKLAIALIIGGLPSHFLGWRHLRDGMMLSVLVAGCRNWH